VMLHPKKGKVIQRDLSAQEQYQQPVVQNIYGNVVQGQTNVNIRDSVVQRSSIGGQGPQTPGYGQQPRRRPRQPRYDDREGDEEGNL